MEMTVSCIAPLPQDVMSVLRVASEWQSTGQQCAIPHQRKSLRHSPQQIKWCALYFGIRKGWSFWISWNPDKPSTLNTTSWHWPRWRLKLPESGQRRQPSSCNMIVPDFIPVWRLRLIAILSYTVLPQPSYTPDLASSDFRLFRLMKNGLHGQYFSSNNAIIALE